MCAMVSFLLFPFVDVNYWNWLLTYGYLDVDIISTSSIHQGVPHVDFSLKINH